MPDHFFDPNEEISFGKGGDLPHWEQKGKLQWVTFRLADSLPKDKLVDLGKMKEDWLRNHPKPWDHLTAIRYRQEIEQKIERWLDAGFGSCALRDRCVAELLETALFSSNLCDYEVYDYVIMPNHVHLIILVYEDTRLSDVMNAIKGLSARNINLYLNRKGKFWERESFDRIIRNPRHFERVKEYIKKNIYQGGVTWFKP